MFKRPLLAALSSLVLITLILFMPGSLNSQSMPNSPPQLSFHPKSKSEVRPLVPFVEYSLPNGLRVLLAPDKHTPVVAACVAYSVGSRDEKPGQAGLAHFLEHLMFQGSANVGRGEHGLLIEETGGTQDAVTGADCTQYYEEVPANQLPLILFLEADRMRGLNLTQETLDNQRAVVEAEKRQRHDHQEYAEVEPTLLRLCYTRFGYGHPTIGTDTDLENVTLTQVRAFFQTYYNPGHAVLTISGDFNAADARARIAQDFSTIPGHVVSLPVDAEEQPLAGERRAALVDDFSRLPFCEIGYRIVPAAHPDFPALKVLANILGAGRTSRLWQALVEPSVALRVSAGAWERQGPGLFVVTAACPAQTSLSSVEATLDAAIQQIQQKGVTPAELQKAKNWLRVGQVSGLYTASDRARQLAETTIVEGSPQAVNLALPSQEAVSAADVQRVARHYLQAGNRVVITDTPVGQSSPVSLL